MAVEPLGYCDPSPSGGAAPLSRSAAAVAAFVGRAERGPIDEAVSIDSFEAYRRIFGGHSAVGYLSYAVQHFFMHGGAAAVVVRLANGAQRAAIDLPAGDDVLRLAARRPSSREYLRVSVDYDRVTDDPLRFNLVVQRVARPGSQLIEDQEYYAGVSLDPGDRRFVVDALRESELIRLHGPLPRCRPDATVPLHPGQPIPYLDMTKPGTDGDELTDYDIVGSNEEGTGLFALDRAGRIDLVCVPALPTRDFGTTALLAAARYCRRRRAFLLWDPPLAWHTTDAAVLGVRALGLASSNVLTYFPRLRPRGQFARFPAGLPASGALAGLLASGDAVRGYPGGLDGALKASLTTLVDVSDKEAALLRRFGINPLRRVSGGGVACDGNACLVPQDKTPTAGQRVDVSRVVLHVLDRVMRETRWVERALAEPDTAVQLEKHVRTLLAELHGVGALAGRGTEETFVARVTHADSSAIVLRVGFAVVRPSQFETYEIEYRPARTVAREVPPLDIDQAVC